MSSGQPLQDTDDSNLSASMGGTDFTLPQHGSHGSHGSRVTQGAYSQEVNGNNSNVHAISGPAAFAFDSDEEEEGYEMPSLDDAARESRARTQGGAGPSGVPKGPQVTRAGPSGKGKDPMFGGSLIDYPSGSDGYESSLIPSSSLVHGTSYLLPDVTAAQSAMYADLQQKELEETLTLGHQDESESMLASTRAKELENFPDLVPPQLHSAFLAPDAQLSGQALAQRVLGRLRRERGENVEEHQVDRVGKHLRRFRAIVRQVMISRVFKTVEELRVLPSPVGAGTIRGYVVVEPQSKLGKTATLFGGKSPHFKYFVQGTTDVEEDRFVLSARKDFSDPFKTQFVMSTDPTPGFEPAGPQFFGRLSGNFVGSKYTLFDRGTIQPTMGSVSDQDERRVLGAIVYEGTVGKTGGGYRRLTALLPNTYRGIGKDGAQKMLGWEDMKDLRDMHILTTKTPSYKKIDGRWCYCYKWGGRVKMPSTKNFQLVLHGNQDAVVLLFGKIEENLYALDYTSPLSAHQAFALALSALDQKLCMAL